MTSSGDGVAVFPTLEARRLLCGVEEGPRCYLKAGPAENEVGHQNNHGDNQK